VRKSANVPEVRNHVPCPTRPLGGGQQHALHQQTGNVVVEQHLIGSEAGMKRDRCLLDDDVVQHHTLYGGQTAGDVLPSREPLDVLGPVQRLA
jgi:hypothetical protein